ncbi:hypothetical protein RAS1_17150 [Phycisphaerae bacterium RAS1]|nr:hypothetical protein RAS1_17150 [Phycisphaerae bacterium RAS1]
MAEFFSFLKVFAICGTVFFVTVIALLAMPQSKLRSVGMEMTTWALAVGLFLLVPSPVDVLPDLVPGIGWLDDIGYLFGALCAVGSALEERKRRKVFGQIEFEQAVAQERGESAAPDDDDKREAA